ncbi:MAG: DUF1559 domain-containing protein, partial [Pirellulaceae bacterium]
QIGLGLHNYHDTFKTFPPLWISTNGPSDRANWITMMLPYIEQVALNGRYDANTSTGGGAGNQFLNGQDVPTFQCPSAIKRPPAPYPGIAGFLWAQGNYVCNNGLGPMRSVPVAQGIATVALNGSAMFVVNRGVGMRDIIDGTSNTMLVTEVLNNGVQGNLSDWRGNLTYPENCMFHWNHAPNTTTPDWLRTALCLSTPRAPCTGTFTAYNTRNIIVSARSYHPGGVQVAFGDGAVRFVSQTLALATWQGLGSPQGGESVTLE